MLEKALIIDEPWISKILNREKDWEMRSCGTEHWGLFGLIKKGTGLVVGIANLTDVRGPFENKELEESFEHHRVGADLYGARGYKWRFAWQLENVKMLDLPVPYQHKSGAVTWVALTDDVVTKISDQITCCEVKNVVDDEIGRLFRVMPQDQEFVVSQVIDSAENDCVSIELDINHVPVARDGTCFTPDECSRRGIYTVGGKGDEKKFKCYSDALRYLSKMDVAKWRRPNVKGNWGIVSAVNWIDYPQNN